MGTPNILETTPSQRRALGVLVIIAMIALLRLAVTVGVGLLLGSLIGFTLQPIYERLRARRVGPFGAALLCSAGATLLVAGMVSLMGYLVASRGAALIRAVPMLFGEGGPLRALIARLAGWLQTWQIDPNEVVSRLGEQAAEYGGRAATLAGGVASVTFGGLLSLFFMALSIFFVLRHWQTLVRQAEILLPLNPRHTRALFQQFRDVGRHVLLGTLLTGLAQGLLAYLIYLIARVPEAAFFGALTAVASLIPVVGTLLVWVPIGIYLAVTGHVGFAIAELIYGAVVVVGVSDYIIRPALVGGEEDEPTLLTFIALFGGVEAFGLIGLVIGPVIVALAVALLRIYRAELESA